MELKSAEDEEPGMAFEKLAKASLVVCLELEPGPDSNLNPQRWSSNCFQGQKEIEYKS